MVTFFLSLLKVLIFGISMYGWGRLTTRWCCRDHPVGWAFAATLGIAVCIAMGGVLNLAHLARLPILATLLLAGLGSALLSLYTAFSEKKQAAGGAVPVGSPASGGLHRAGTAIYYALLLGSLVFLVSTLMPAHNFNYHDDFHVYLRWPVKMTETGSLGGDPFSHIGLSSLGAQAFMQGMFLTFSSLSEVNGFGAILCQILFLGLLKEFGERLGINIFFILAACTAALFINPQYVNITSLYSASLMLLGLTYSTMLLAESIDSPEPSSPLRLSLPCALFLAALLSLKTTFVFVAPLFWTASLAGSLLLLGDKKRVLLAHLASAAGTVLLLLPWLGIYLDRYLLKVHYILDGIRYPEGKSFRGSLQTKGDVLSQLFSQKHLLYGNTFRDYIGLVLMLCFALLTAVLIAWRLRGRRENRQLVSIMALLLGVLLTYPFYYKMTFFAAYQDVRYSCPLLIAASSAAVLLAGWLWTEGAVLRREKAGKHTLPLVLGGLLLASQLPTVGGFWQNFLQRVERAYNYGTLISFPAVMAPRNVDYNRYALSEEARQRLAALQNLVPAGASILAWVSLPIYLDYRRNTIYATSEYGLSNQLLVMPFTEGTEGMRNFFRQYGIRYFIWEYKGFGMKQAAQYGGIQRKFIQTLTDMLTTGKTLYNDGNTVVFDIGPAG